jgi:tRNA pseudouridine55 synthase
MGPMTTADPALVLVDKPSGWTSRKAGAVVSKALGIRKVGHLGTLDPFATGLLPLCVGRGTRLSHFLDQSTKVYDAVLQLGIATDSADRDGEVIETTPVRSFDEADLNRVRLLFSGEIEQIPPAFSAIRIDGQRAYKLARQGKTVEMPPRQVMIHQLSLERLASDQLRIAVTCGSGTYVRSLGRDIAKSLDNIGHLLSLRRLRVGSLEVAEAASPEALNSPAVWSTARLLERLGRRLDLAPHDCAIIRDGKPLNQLLALAQLEDARYGVFDDGEPVALVERIDEDWRILRGLPAAT